MTRNKWMILLVAAAMISLAGPRCSAAPMQRRSKHAGKLRIFILAGQSNMVGKGQVYGDAPGTMQTCVKEHPYRYRELVDKNGKPVTRHDVWIVNISQRHQQGWLGIGYGTDNTHIGPEYGFGFAVGDYYPDPVMIIKCAWGGKSLGYDFLPPRSADYPAPNKPGDKGYYFAETAREVKEITGHLQRYYPGYHGQGYRIAGFAWHQGWNDRINAKFVDAYETNMVNFIQDMRTALGIKDLPFVIANTGMGGWTIPDKARWAGRAKKLMNAQLAPGDPTKCPQFAGTVIGVDTRYFSRPQNVSPSRQSYHWYRNWATYYEIGQAMGRAMIDIVRAQKEQGY